jgi:hypothetical protein
MARRIWGTLEKEEDDASAPLPLATVPFQLPPLGIYGKNQSQFYKMADWEQGALVYGKDILSTPDPSQAI